MYLRLTLQATLLLCCYFNNNEVSKFKPLTPTEYGKFSRWMHGNKFNPADLLQRKNEVLVLWSDQKEKISSERIEGLLSRGVSMGFALEKWSKAGLWVMSKADSDYPKALKKKLQDVAPPVLFGIGNKELFNNVAVGFVGSRTIDLDDEAFTTVKAQLAVKQGYTVVSGGAKGVDQISMLSALNAGGCCIGVLADSLFRSSASKVYRDFLANQKLVLVSPFYPEAGFNVGNAMARNKYIYSLAKAVIVVKSDHDKGGTWTGAQENLKKGWSVELVRNITYSGNQELIKLGAYAVDDDFDDFNQEVVTSSDNLQVELNVKKPKPDFQIDLFSIDSDNFVESSSKELNESQISRSYANKDQPDFSNGANSVEMSVDKLDIEEYGNHASLVVVQDSELVERIHLEEYGSLLNLFYLDIVQHCKVNNKISLDDLINLYPELTKQGITKWMGILLKEDLIVIVKDGRKNLYHLT